MTRQGRNAAAPRNTKHLDIRRQKRLFVTSAAPLAVADRDRGDRLTDGTGQLRTPLNSNVN